MNTKFSQKDKNQLNYKVLVADFGMDSKYDYSGNRTEYRKKYLQIINMFSGKVEEYIFNESYNRVEYNKKNYPENCENKSDFDIMWEYVDNYKNNGFRNATIVNDVIAGNNEEVEKYINQEVEYRLKQELEKRGIKA